MDTACRDYLAHLTPEKFLRKVGAGESVLPLVRMETSQNSEKGVHLQDLAEWIDARRVAARRECSAVTP
ncbi:pyocin activator PrtN family protein [Prosthecomicrobium hirschii]|uniref:pyocin activator PrtN family protein n=1 Tax=Prosthecodimorpha hirschii TaxID=665126 RepID=UPI003084673F